MLFFFPFRYIAICHPFQATTFCTVKRARQVVATLAICSALLDIPKFFEYQTVAVRHPVFETLRVTNDLSPFGRSTLFRQIYHYCLYLVFVGAIPLLLLIVFNAFLVRDVRLSGRRLRDEATMTNDAAIWRPKNDTTVMLIGVIFVFFVCQTPALVSRVIWAFVSDPRTFRDLRLYALNEAGNFLVSLNSAVNVIPYYLFGRRFRRQTYRLFSSVFRCGCEGPEDSAVAIYQLEPQEQR